MIVLALKRDWYALISRIGIYRQISNSLLFALQIIVLFPHGLRDLKILKFFFIVIFYFLDFLMDLLAQTVWWFGLNKRDWVLIIVVLFIRDWGYALIVVLRLFGLRGGLAWDVGCRFLWEWRCLIVLRRCLWKGLFLGRYYRRAYQTFTIQDVF